MGEIVVVFVVIFVMVLLVVLVVVFVGEVAVVLIGLDVRVVLLV